LPRDYCFSTLQVAGKYDLLVKKGEKTILRDYKTSSGFYIDQFYSLSSTLSSFINGAIFMLMLSKLFVFGKKAETFETKLIADKDTRDQLAAQTIRNAQHIIFAGSMKSSF